nr:hypothetical protein [Gemmatimonadota bacterium]
MANRLPEELAPDADTVKGWLNRLEVLCSKDVDLEARSLSPKVEREVTVLLYMIEDDDWPAWVQDTIDASEKEAAAWSVLQEWSGPCGPRSTAASQSHRYSIGCWMLRRDGGRRRPEKTGAHGSADVMGRSSSRSANSEGWASA